MNHKPNVKETGPLICATCGSKVEFVADDDQKITLDKIDPTTGQKLVLYRNRHVVGQFKHMRLN